MIRGVTVVTMTNKPLLNMEEADLCKMRDVADKSPDYRSYKKIKVEKRGEKTYTYAIVCDVDYVENDYEN